MVKEDEGWKLFSTKRERAIQGPSEANGVITMVKEEEPFKDRFSEANGVITMVKEEEGWKIVLYQARTAENVPLKSKNGVRSPELCQTYRECDRRMHTSSPLLIEDSNISKICQIEYQLLHNEDLLVEWVGVGCGLLRKYQ